MGCNGAIDMESRDPTRRMLSEKEAARYLSVSIDTVRRMRYLGILPYVPIGPSGRRKFYDVQDLDLWIERSKVREPQ